MEEEKYLQLKSFEMNEETIQAIFDMNDIYYIKLPQLWRSYFFKKGKDWKYNNHMRQFNESLQYTFPQIFYANLGNDNYWLLSFVKIDIDLIELLWKQMIKLMDQNVDVTLEEKLTWEKVERVEHLGAGEHFRWIPAFFARKFSEGGRKHLYINPNVDGKGDYPTLDKEVNFYPIKFHQTYECISEVIQRKNKDGETEGSYSYVIQFSYHNRAFLPEKGILNVKFGIRRYLEKGIKSEANVRWGKTKGSMLVQIDSPLLENEKTFAHWKFQKIRGELKWEYNTENFMKQTADLFGMTLDPVAVLKNPHAYREGESIALPVYNNKVYDESSLTATKAGMSLQEKNYLFKLVRESFSFLTLLPRGREIKGARGSKALTPIIVANKKMTYIRLEVWGPENLMGQFIAQNSSLLDKDPTHPNVYLLHTEGEKLPIEIVQMDPEEVIRGKAKKEKDHTFIGGVVDRLSAIEQMEDVTTIALIEIETEKEYGGKKYDPKQLLRIAFANTGRITQFIHPLQMEGSTLEKESEERLKSCFKDLLSDLSLYPQRLRKSGIGEDIVFSLGMFARQGSFLPIVSYFSVYHPLQVKTYHAHTKKWQLFHEALINFSKYKTDYLMKQKDAKYMIRNIVQFFIDSLLEVLKETKGKVIVVIDDRYRSYQFRQVQNTGLENLYQLIESSIPAEYVERLRFVRVSRHQEIPQYRIWDKKTYINYDSGLFSTNRDIYYSIALRMNNMRGVNKHSLKYSNVDTFYVHQSLVEIVTIGCKTKEESDDLAKVIHQLRRAPITTETGTIQPYPLHLYQSFKKYLSMSKANGKGSYSFFNDEPDYAFYDRLELEMSVAEQLAFPFGFE